MRLKKCSKPTNPLKSIEASRGTQIRKLNQDLSVIPTVRNCSHPTFSKISDLLFAKLGTCSFRFISLLLLDEVLTISFQVATVQVLIVRNNSGKFYPLARVNSPAQANTLRKRWSLNKTKNKKCARS